MKFLYDVPAPAKLNLFLHVTGRRADGYHLLQTAMVLIDWCDTLHFELRAGGAISRQDLATPLPADDLTVRAARALQSATGTTQGVHIQVDKRIPSQAGMGGGSSDAASTLLALHRLWNLELPLAALASIGLQLGADVPFFLSGGNAWVEGIGEKIAPLEIPVGRFVVVKPPDGLDTRLIFSDPSLKRDSDAAILAGFAGNPQDFGRNDLQIVAQKVCPGVSQALEWLAAQGLDGRMTGSGSAVFAWAAPDAALNAAPAGFEVRSCSGLRVHPLKGWAKI
ncbi:MAG: 4-(cytidine 5'-diphospho)-2-C-methyl-D-erythritol kinase [Rhodoferax sp.]|nr:4-(cytidine 5'-diphospho)-2-C-methyl-D-erythritol kinase [Rhodoferax sp.]MBP9929175.1 4-(cytidine 5'-diphospho)-2-C-methyl-D-erythritol kinase [Rhodoferax sp.]HQX58141.1 4-(cytidine 5'-diphospho)-2-C-methyl-D-erythritol kinase [Burkholderiaceae bacterium]HQZ07326.1 4-(cytidine 5'-diphospho)-2-C-methyl-D-erythritol kinase [Burkholderiaceae bacterium]